MDIELSRLLDSLPDKIEGQPTVTKRFLSRLVATKGVEALDHFLERNWGKNSSGTIGLNDAEKRVLTEILKPGSTKYTRREWLGIGISGVAAAVLVEQAAEGFYHVIKSHQAEEKKDMKAAQEHRNASNQNLMNGVEASSVSTFGMLFTRLGYNLRLMDIEQSKEFIEKLLEIVDTLEPRCRAYIAQYQLDVASLRL